MKTGVYTGALQGLALPEFLTDIAGNKTSMELTYQYGALGTGPGTCMEKSNGKQKAMRRARGGGQKQGGEATSNDENNKKSNWGP